MRQSALLPGPVGLDRSLPILRFHHFLLLQQFWLFIYSTQCFVDTVVVVGQIR